VQAGQSVRSGTKLGHITDFFGKTLQEVVAPFDGLLMMVVGTPPISEGEPLVTIVKSRRSNEGSNSACVSSRTLVQSFKERGVTRAVIFNFRSVEIS
jgi:hypothetical protein